MPMTEELRRAFDNEESAIEIFEANEEIVRLQAIIRRIETANQFCDLLRYDRISALVREARSQ